MNNWFYIWNTQTPFGWAALGGSPFGARRFDFGYRTRDACMSQARLFADDTAAHKLRADQLIKHSGPTKGPGWLFAGIVLITRYFLGESMALADIPLDLSPHTAFEKSIWNAAREIPYGQTRPYSWIAAKAGHPGAARAAGNALGANPMPLLIPCHRIIKADGCLGGFGMGPDMKEKLIKLEAHASK